MFSPTVTAAGALLGGHIVRRRALPVPYLCRLCHGVGSCDSGGSPRTGVVRVNVTTAEGQGISFSAPSGMTLMEALRDVARVDIEAACDGTCACSTCHVIVDEKDYGKLGSVSEDEMDMLDLAPKVTPTSRLACQVKLTDDLDGITVTMPDETSNEML